MNYPSISDYIEALRDAEDSLSELKDLRLVYDDQGHPIMSSGNFAVVFKMQAPTGEYHALKCFLRDQEERSERYRLIAEELQYVQSTYLVKFRYLESELFVDVPNTEGEEYPVLLMEWVDGIPLDQYLKRIINKSYEKDLLAYRFSLLARWLVTQPFAHGDLKPDNICVRGDGSLVLLDYDGMYVPALSGRKPLEQGSPHYRHPLRSTLPFDEHIDDYSLSLILLSLRAIAFERCLYYKYSSNEYLLFPEKDQMNPYTSPAFKELNHLILRLGFIKTYHTYLKALQSPHLHLEAYDFSLLAPILMYRRAAELGDPEGMYNLGDIYEDGKGEVTKDEEEAIVWYRKAVEARHGKSAKALARIYKDKDEAMTVEWYRKGIELGDSCCMYNLGRSYAYGEGGLTKDEAKAVEWYRRSAKVDTSCGCGMVALGISYEEGKDGLSVDKKQAVKWYQKAAALGHPRGMLRLGLAYENAMGGLTKDEVKAVEWYRKAAEAGNARGMSFMGHAYEYGQLGLTKDETKAVEWYQKAAEAEDSLGMRYLGYAYYNATGGLTKDDVQAGVWWRKAAEAGDATAMFNLGIYYQYGQGGLTKDEAKAVEWYQKAAEAGNATAMCNLGNCYEYGKGGLTKGEAKAVEWYQKAAEAGNATAMLNLGRFYYNGQGGLTKDDVQAVVWWRKAAEAGDATAMFKLGVCYEARVGMLTKDEAKALEWYRKAAEAGSSEAVKRLQELGRNHP